MNSVTNFDVTIRLENSELHCLQQNVRKLSIAFRCFCFEITHETTVMVEITVFNSRLCWGRLRFEKTILTNQAYIKKSNTILKWDTYNAKRNGCVSDEWVCNQKLVSKNILLWMRREPRIVLGCFVLFGQPLFSSLRLAWLPCVVRTISMHWFWKKQKENETGIKFKKVWFDVKLVARI